MFNDVTQIIARKGWVVEVEYIQDVERIMAYGVLSTPVLVIDGKVAMVGYRGASKIELALQTALDAEHSG
jgi:predicted DsbA family dithiol-disulfide isomerase